MEDRKIRRNKSGKFARGNRGGPGRPRYSDEKEPIRITHRPPPSEPPTYDLTDQRYWGWQSAELDWVINGYWEPYE